MSNWCTSNVRGAWWDLDDDDDDDGTSARRQTPWSSRSAATRAAFPAFVSPTSASVTSRLTWLGTTRCTVAEDGPGITPPPALIGAVNVDAGPDNDWRKTSRSRCASSWARLRRTWRGLSVRLKKSKRYRRRTSGASWAGMRSSRLCATSSVVSWRKSPSDAGKRATPLRSQRRTRRRGSAAGIQATSATRLLPNVSTSRRDSRDRAATGSVRSRGRCESHANVRNADRRPMSAGTSLRQLRSTFSTSRLGMLKTEIGSERRCVCDSTRVRSVSGDSASSSSWIRQSTRYSVVRVCGSSRRINWLSGGKRSSCNTATTTWSTCVHCQNTTSLSKFAKMFNRKCFAHNFYFNHMQNV